VLLILDGFGYNEDEVGNAIHLARTPNWDRLWSSSPHALLDCSGGAVGLPDDQMGNSEVGHLHLGMGRLLAQDFTRINDAIKNGEFFANPVLNDAVDQALAGGKALHIFGLLSPGGVHSHELHIQAMAELAAKKGLDKIYIHAFLDGRDTPPKSAGESIRAMEAKLAELGAGKIADLVGRFYVMDRDNRWERVSKAYDLLVHGRPEFTAASALEGLEAAYARGETDEFVQTTAVVAEGEEPVKIEDGDAIVFMNFRADRAREISRALNEPDFSGFERVRVPRLSYYATLTEYQEDFPFPVAYPPAPIANGLGECLSKLGLKQLRLAETEKYAHVTFFFNGGQETPFEGETRILVPSPKVKTYDMQPEMSAPEVTDHLVQAIESQAYDVIICNYANCDMVGHTGIVDAAVKAIETIDQALGRIMEALQKTGGEMLVTADHGNVEQMVDPATGETLTAHTVCPVPLVYAGGSGQLADGGNLADIAPTLLAIMGLTPPAEMTGRVLLA
jgi:2,3-bisphosphoglycerate-independent phosphoglycerate mutase